MAVTQHFSFCEVSGSIHPVMTGAARSRAIAAGVVLPVAKK